MSYETPPPPLPSRVEMLHLVDEGAAAGKAGQECTCTKPLQNSHKLTLSQQARLEQNEKECRVPQTLHPSTQYTQQDQRKPLLFY